MVTHDLTYYSAFFDQFVCLIEVGQAHKLIEKGGVMGKIIVTMGLFSLP